MSQSFQSLNEYQKEDLKYFVDESLILEKEDDDGTLGKIIDRGLTFVPRAMRFKKAKKVMKRSLNKFTIKAKSLVSSFAKGFKDKVTKVDREYKSFYNSKIKPLLDDEEKVSEAVELMESQKKELEEWRKSQIATLDKGIEDVLQAYTSSIEKRIEAPGFVLNVELSEKGKGELRAKWQELASIQKMKVDEQKTELISSPGWKRLEEILAEMTSFIKNRRQFAGDLDLSIQNIKQTSLGFLVKVHLRTFGRRINVKEKGIIYGPNSDNLILGVGTSVADKSNYAYNAKPYTIPVKKTSEEQYVRPYLVIKETSKPIYGDILVLEPTYDTGSEYREAVRRQSDIDPNADIDQEEDIIPAENK